MIKTATKNKPIVYSCSGCSSAAQMSNYLAIQLDRKDLAEMGCIAGVGGSVKNIVRTAQSGRKIIVIDGCPLACSKACLLKHAIHPTIHFELTSLGVKKKYHEDFDLEEAEKILQLLEQSIAKGREKLNGVFRPTAVLANILIQEVQTKRQLHEFIDFPLRLYKGNEFYVPQLSKDVETTFDRKKNPAFDQCEARYWLAYRGNKVVGRITGIINHAYIEKWGNKYMRFGWVDFENDEEVAKLLLEQVEAWAKERGLIAVHGPLGFTNFDNAGMLINGFDQLGTAAAIYNYPYYSQLMGKAGYVKDVDWVEYKIKLPQAVPEKLKKIAAIVQRRLDLNIIKIGSTKEILHYSKDIFNLLNSTYSELYGMVPLTEKQIQYYTRKYLSYIRPDFVSLVSDNMGKLVAFGITMPSISYALQKAKGRLYPVGFIHILKALQKNILADLYLVAVRKDFQGKGVNGLIMHELTRSFIKNGIESAESNPELEQNMKVQSIWEYYQTAQHKRRRCYIKHL